jgi:Domain of unknown function (DUF1996)
VLYWLLHSENTKQHSCWDGKNLDSPDHKSHVAYPTAGPASFDTDGGACPTTHPVKIPQVMLEVSTRSSSRGRITLEVQQWPNDSISIHTFIQDKEDINL